MERLSVFLVQKCFLFCVACARAPACVMDGSNKYNNVINQKRKNRKRETSGLI
uniref:Uncharacterized protein n=1 Tax=Rhizophora mucronata TaxID=61149 RepID=A0A2P2IYW2_RHIMU